MKRKPVIIDCTGNDLTMATIKQYGDRTVKISLWLSLISEEDYFHYPPDTRKKKIEEWFRFAYKEIVSLWPSKIIKKFGSHRAPKGFVSEIKASDFNIIENFEQIQRVEIEEVEGLAKMEKAEQRKKRYFSVKAYFGRQIESITDGFQMYEERILLVKAYDSEDAVRIAKKEFKEYGFTYLSPPKFLMVRIKFYEVIDIYDTATDRINPDGTKVFAKFRRRRMKPEYEWHPEYQDDGQSNPTLPPCNPPIHL